MDNSEETKDDKIDSQRSRKPSVMEVLVMTLILFSSIGAFYCSGIPGSLQEALTKYVTESSYYFALFYSVCALPSSIFSIISGYMVDSSFGIRKTTYLFVSTILLGSLLFSIGGPLDSYNIMVLGRFLFGCGQGTILGPINFYYTILWFKNTYASLMFSLTDNLSTVGTLLVYMLSTRILEVVSDGKPSKEGLNITVGITSSVVLLTASSLIIVSLLKPKNETTFISKKTGKFLDCLKFPWAFWILAFVYSTLSNAIYTFEQFSQVMFMQEFEMTAIEASDPITVLNLTKIILAFPAGILVDRFGRNVLFLIVSLTLPLIAHILLVLKFNPYLNAGILGLGYSFTAASLWPMYGHLLNEANYGIGIGILGAFINLLAFFCTIAAGKIIDIYGYFWVQLYFIIVLAIGLLILLLMRFLDKDSTIHLNMTPEERNKISETTK